LATSLAPSVHKSFQKFTTNVAVAFAVILVIEGDIRFFLTLFLFSLRPPTGYSLGYRCRKTVFHKVQCPISSTTSAAGQ
jgi:hypothetical protein